MRTPKGGATGLLWGAFKSKQTEGNHEYENGRYGEEIGCLRVVAQKPEDDLSISKEEHWLGSKRQHVLCM
jgi:hypothetical protein